MALGMFTKIRNKTLQPRYDPRRYPYAGALTAAYTAHASGNFTEALTRCAMIERDHGPTPFTQMLAVLILKDRAGERDAALKGMEAIVDQWPGWIEARYNMGAVYQELGEWDKGLHQLRRAIQIAPDHVPTMIQMGICFAALNRIDEANAWWNCALEYTPATVRDEYHLSPIFAARGDFAQWARLQELRWEAQESYQFDHGATPQVMATAEPWTGDSLDGHDLLVLDEQGVGDIIQHARYLPTVCNQARSVWLRLKNEQLRPLIQNIEPRVQIVMQGDPLPLVTRVVGLMSLYHRCCMVQRLTPPFPQNYVRHENTAYGWCQTVGICWAGATSHPRDAQRSMSTDVAARIEEKLSYVKCIDFTIGRGPSGIEPMVTPRHYGDTASQLSGLHALVTVDTSVAHLAGAMGLPTIVMVTTLPDMRWGLSGDRTPWYDSWTIVRQTSPNDWTSMIEQLPTMLFSLLSP
jgi:hypothetical protein